MNPWNVVYLHYFLRFYKKRHNVIYSKRDANRLLHVLLLQWKLKLVQVVRWKQWLQKLMECGNAELNDILIDVLICKLFSRQSLLTTNVNIKNQNWNGHRMYRQFITLVSSQYIVSMWEIWIFDTDLDFVRLQISEKIVCKNLKFAF